MLDAFLILDIAACGIDGHKRSTTDRTAHTGYVPESFGMNVQVWDYPNGILLSLCRCNPGANDLIVICWLMPSNYYVLRVIFVMHCEGCGIIFELNNHPQLTTCAKCIKLEAAAAEAPERKEELKKLLQCKGCGAVFPHMPGLYCAACAQVINEPQATTHHDTSAITAGAAVHRAHSTALRINQKAIPKQPLNRGLQNAAQLRKSNQVLKETSKIASISIEGTLWIYPSSKQKLAQAGSRHTAPFNTPVRDALNGFLDVLRQDFETVPNNNEDEYRAIIASLQSYNHGNSFQVQKDATTSSPLSIEDVDTTIRSLHIRLTQIEDLSKEDVAGNKLTLRVVAWAPRPLKRERGQNISADEEFDDYASVSSKWRTRQTPSLQHSMRTCSHVSVHPSRPAHVQRTVSAVQVGTYDPKVAGPSLSSLSSFVCYDAYTFLRITWTCEPSSKITLNHREVEETILVANDWAKHNYQSQPRGSYLGSGIEKYAFRNRKDMLRALTHLVTADHFMKSFFACAEAANVIMPKMRYNAHGAFVGVVNSDKVGPRPTKGHDVRSLHYPVFFANPLLTGKTKKYSGSDEADDSGWTTLVADIQGMIQNDEIILYNPQIHRTDAAVDGFMAQHVCNHLCVVLALTHERPSQTPGDNYTELMGHESHDRGHDIDERVMRRSYLKLTDM
ncbi:hypothetical protein K439DRAFT_1610545 [Ramaria rubella]|nr:hypothetical protein K439DRAFT_1610545 [Ramaria rubella]